MKYSTGYKTITGEEIKLGDKIQGLQSHEVIVLWSNKDKDFIVEIADQEIQNRTEYKETLKEFIEAWNGKVRKIGNILER